MHFIFSLIISLVIAYIFIRIARRFNIPDVVALIFAGLLIGFPAIKDIILEPNTDLLFLFGDIGLISLMFLAGLESSRKELYKEEKDSIIIALFAAVIPFLMGFAVSMLLGFSIATSLTVGICMSVTAEASKSSVLMGLRKLRTKLGSIMTSSGILDDLFALSLFLILLYFIKKVFSQEDLLLAGVILAFFIGVLVQRRIGRENIKLFEKGLLHFLAPFFFISMGLHFNFQSLTINPYILLIIIIVAIGGKILGVVLTKPIIDLSLKQLYLIGWAMNSRGELELAIAIIAFRGNLLPVELYSSIVVMALVTTLIFPFIITRDIKKDPSIMD